jgi:hypothetical protein
VAVAVTIAIGVSDYTEPVTRPPDAFAYALGTTIGVLLLSRRHWPLGVLIASVVTLQVYHFAAYPGISAAVPLAVALYTAAAAGRLRWSVGSPPCTLPGCCCTRSSGLRDHPVRCWPSSYATELS